MTPRAALSIAGSDSGGGAGLQADLKTFAAAGVHAATAVTAVTAQSTSEVAGVMTVSPDFLRLQIETVLADLPVAATKTGMLASAANVELVGELAQRGALPNLVVDPVLVSSSGHALLEEGGVLAYRERLVPHALVVTPNLREAAVLTGRQLLQLRDEDSMVEAAEELRALGAEVVVVKGGHLGGSSSPDVVVGPSGQTLLQAERVATGNDHGSGCSLSAAIAARLALGRGVEESVAEAKDYVRRSLAGSARWSLGAGHGPIDHFGWGEG